MARDYFAEFRHPETHVLYCARLSGKSRWTSPADVKAEKPKPWGYGSRIADTSLHCGHMLVALLDAHEARPDPFLKENIGKGAVIVKADALVALGDYNEAMKSLEAILKNTKPGDPWINSVHQKRAEILGKAEKAGVQLERDPGALHSSALGLYQKRDFEKAVRAYRKAILAARDPDLGYLDRLKWEPRCWFSEPM